jgi:hypothetical protein
MTVTFYDVFNIDTVQYVCGNGHTTQTEEECDRVCNELKERERRLITSYIGRLVLSSLAGGALLLFGCWAALILIVAYAPKYIAAHATILSLFTGGALVGLYLVFVTPRLFRTFIAYYWAKRKSKNEVTVDSEDPLGALS